MRIIRAISLTFAILMPVAAIASPTVGGACCKTMSGCPDCGGCPNCPDCPDCPDCPGHK